MERLLIGQLIRSTSEAGEDEQFMPDRSPSILNKHINSSPSSMTESFTSALNNSSSKNDEKKCPNEIQNNLSDAVNKIVKWFYRRHRRIVNGGDNSSDTSALTNLLCGEGGFVEHLTAAFLLGFKSQRIFGRNFYLWDFFGKKPLYSLLDFFIYKLFPLK